MNEWLANLTAQLQSLSPARRAAFAATAIGSLAFFLWLGFALNGPDERLLFRNLADDEAARVVDGLTAERIPYRLDEGGGAVYVPAAQVHEARIRIAGKGLPSGGSPGFEIFDEQGFGVTDFLNRVNYQRGLQGELARSVEQLDAVERARVQVAVPERSGFVAERSREPSAAVVVRIRPGHELAPHQARAIVHLVASSVEGLDSGRVTLVDERGRMLGGESDEVGGPAPSGALRHQANLESELSGRIQAMLEPTVGAGGVVARVSATLDWTQTESTEERFDPDSQVARSEEIVEESSSDGRGAAGVPGIASNSPDLPGGTGAGPSGGRSTRSTETINYEISKVVSRTVSPVGAIRQLDVAVLVDAIAAEDGTSTPWDAESLAKFEELAKRAVGFSSERGDRITVSSVPFRTIELEEEPAPAWLSPEILLLVSAVLRFLGIVVAAIVFAKLVVAPLGSRLAGGAAPPLPARADQVEMQLAAAGAGSNLQAGEIPAPTPTPALGGAAGDEAVKALRVWLSER